MGRKFLAYENDYSIMNGFGWREDESDQARAKSQGGASDEMQSDGRAFKECEKQDDGEQGRRMG